MPVAIAKFYTITMTPASKICVSRFATVAIACGLTFAAAGQPPQRGTTPDAPVDFEMQIRPILSARCVKCHTRGQRKGGFSIETRESVLAGGESGPAVVVGKGGESLLIELVSGADASRVMPQKGERLTADEIARLRAWIDQGLKWPDGFSFGFPRASVEPRRVKLPEPAVRQAGDHPIDRLLESYLREHEVSSGDVVPDRVFARRVYLDLVGLLPTPEQLAEFEKDGEPDKRPRLVRRLLDDRRSYSDHWLTFWNDALRNAYAGTGYIDGGRLQITGWLYRSLYENKPYDQFVRELISPVAGSEGFTKGIVWRGVVNASQVPAMQAAQNTAQVFLGTNLKCASCHDSFVNHWKLKDAYALASVFADGPLELHRCDKPTGEMAVPGFIFSELGSIDPAAPRAERQRQLADIVTSEQDGRLARTIVNRLWAWFFGRGLVDPLDDMDQPPWHADLLDWLAVDLAEHSYDLKYTMATICTSRAYQLASVGAPAPGDKSPFVFRGPFVKRMTAEQFVDAANALVGVRPAATPPMLKADARNQFGQLAAVNEVSPTSDDQCIRTALFADDPLSRALGRSNREQVVTRRDSIATTLQALELTNGLSLDQLLKTGAQNWLRRGRSAAELVSDVYRAALGRLPTPAEAETAIELVGSPPTQEGIEDLLWAILMLPEFQLIR